MNRKGDEGSIMEITRYKWKPNFRFGMYPTEKMWICSKCGYQTNDKSVHCSECGTFLDNSKECWINPKEALPKEDSYVLVTIQIPKREPKVRSSFYQNGYFINDNGDFWKESDREVKAWMYSPEPYKEIDNEFEIGDEVISIYGSKGCVTGFHDDELCVLYRNGTVGHSTKCTYKKTGRQFPFLVAVLNKMKESD